MFDVPGGARRALGTYRVADDLPLLDFDDANALVERALRPTQIVSPNRTATQSVALAAFRETAADGSPRWAGLSWWSSRRSSWPVHFVWGQEPTCVQVDDLALDHPAVQDAAASLAKPFG